MEGMIRSTLPTHLPIYSLSLSLSHPPTSTHARLLLSLSLSFSSFSFFPAVHAFKNGVSLSLRTDLPVSNYC